MKKAFLIAFILGLASLVSAAAHSDTILDRISVSNGICVVLGDAKCELAIKLARETDLLIYVQLQQDKDVEPARKAVDDAGYYGQRIYVEKGALTRIHLADNLADVVIAVGQATKVPKAEVLRVLRPEGKALLGNKELVKPFPEGVDDWSHPYHGPDNNPQSKDLLARAPYLTQFLAEPYYAPCPQVAVASAGRVFKAFGHIAWHKREEPMLNKLVAFNGYNGTILWQRNITPGIMVHRNTMIATPDTLYVGDDRSCKLIDTATGRLKDQIIPPLKDAGGTFWKWMAIEDGVLYALIGAQEPKDPVSRWRRKKKGGWPWNKISDGYNAAENPWGFGKNLLAIDPKTKEILWTHHEEEPVDSRAVCMKNGRIYIFRFGAYLACLDAKTGKVIWRKTPDNAPQLFEAFGPYLHRQGYNSNWRTAAYLKCSDKALYFAGPQLSKLLAVSAEDGRVLWEDPYDRYQLILRDDVVYGITGQKPSELSKKFDPLTGQVLAEVNVVRKSCTRPTGSIDGIFVRCVGAKGSSVRLDLATNRLQYITPIRPPCHDGVTIANSMLYWWPWTCDCQISLSGVTCLGPAGDFEFNQQATEAERLEKRVGDLTKVAALPESPADWPTFRANNTGTVTTDTIVSQDCELLWQFSPKTKFTPTAPVTVGGLVFLSGSDGIVRTFDAATGDMRWKVYTGGAVRFPPTVWNGRAFVGSGDGWVYAFEAQTGQRLWRFRAAPAHRKIPVYGTLLSTWPAASGVLVEDGVAYVAAGIVDYDGTGVYALDAVTGQIKWQNNSSGHLAPQNRSGVSVQGHMLLYDGKLCLAGGVAISPAIYDIKDGKCLNDPEPLKQYKARAPRGQELYLLENKINISGQPFYGHRDYPVYNSTVINKMLLASSGDKDITWVNNQKVMCFARVEENRAERFTAGWGKLDIPDLRPLWEYQCDQSVALAVAKNAVVVATQSRIVALDIKNGRLLWEQMLPAAPVPWGLALDRDGRAIITLEDGRIVCYGQKKLLAAVK